MAESILFELFLAAATGFIVIAGIALLVLARSSWEKGREKREEPRATAEAVIHLEKLGHSEAAATREETEKEGAAATMEAAGTMVGGSSGDAEARQKAEEPLDEFSYERSGFYKWFHAQIRRAQEDRKNMEGRQ